MTKMTKKMAFELAQKALDTIDTEDAVNAWNILQKEIDRLEAAKVKARTTETKADKEHAAFRAQVLEMVREADAPIRAGELAKLMDVNVQKASAALNFLFNDGKLEKAYDKRVALFSIKAE